MGLLDDLKKAAEAKQAEIQLEQQDLNTRDTHLKSAVHPKLVQIFSYLNELVEHVDVLQQDIRADYKITGFDTLTGLKQHGYKLRSDSRENMSNLFLSFQCSTDEKPVVEIEGKIQVEREKDYLKQNNLAFHSRDFRDDRHDITHSRFTLEGKIPILFDFRILSEQGLIELTVCNFEGLGRHRYRLAPENINVNFLDELGQYILREKSDFLKLEISDEYRQSLRERLENSSANIKRPKISKIAYLDDKRKEKQAEESAELLIGNQFSQADLLENQDVVDSANIYTQFSNLPVPSKQPLATEVDEEAITVKLAQARSKPEKFFQIAAQALSNFNRSIISADKRIELINVVVAQAYPELANIIEQYQQHENSFPETQKRRETLLACISFVEQLAIAYKHVFKRDIAVGDASHQPRLYLSGFRILEVLRVEQRLRALRYQKSPKGVWHDCNSVFLFLLDHADIEQQFEFLGTASAWSFRHDDNDLDRPRASIRQVYLSMQLFGLLDVITWPMWLFHIPDDYLDLLENGLRILPDKGQKIVPGWLSVCLNQDSPADFERIGEPSSPALIIDYANLFNFLVKEHELLSKNRLVTKQQTVNISWPLQKVHEHDQLPVLEMMLLNLRERKRHLKRHDVSGNEKFNIYFGFEDSYQSLLAACKRDKETEQVGEASGSADGLASPVTPWDMINFSTGGMLLGIDEGEFSSYIEIGQLISFMPEGQQQTPILGHICRMQRTSYRNLEIAVNRLAHKAEACVAKSLDKKQEQTVILMQDIEGHWKLLAENKDGYSSGTPLQITRADGTKIPARLGGIWLVKNRFTIFDLSSPVLS